MIQVNLQVNESIENVALNVSESNPTVNLNVETIITRVPNNYGLITWNGSYITVS